MKQILRSVAQIIVCTWIISSHAQQSFNDLQEAVEKAEVHRVEGFLNQGLDPNTTDASGHTLLMKAARLGHTEIVKLLIGRKASVGRLSPAGDTALMHACLGGNLSVVQALVEAGSVINRRGWAPLHYASYGGSGAVVKLLLDRGAELEAVAPNGYTAIMLAARNGNQDATKVLLNAKPNLGHRDAAGQTALTLAVKADHPEVVKLLKAAGATE